MVRFRCKRSGNYITLKNQADIDGLRKHEGYEEVPTNEDQSPAPTEQTPEPVAQRRRGRARRTE